MISTSIQWVLGAYAVQISIAGIPYSGNCFNLSVYHTDWLSFTHTLSRSGQGNVEYCYQSKDQKYSITSGKCNRVSAGGQVEPVHFVTLLNVKAHGYKPYTKEKICGDYCKTLVWQDYTNPFHTPQCQYDQDYSLRSYESNRDTCVAWAVKVLQMWSYAQITVGPNHSITNANRYGCETYAGEAGNEGSGSQRNETSVGTENISDGAGNDTAHSNNTTKSNDGSGTDNGNSDSTNGITDGAGNQNFWISGSTIIEATAAAADLTDASEQQKQLLEDRIKMAILASNEFKTVSARDVTVTLAHGSKIAEIIVNRKAVYEGLRDINNSVNAAVSASLIAAGVCPGPCEVVLSFTTNIGDSEADASNSGKIMPWCTVSPVSLTGLLMLASSEVR